MVIILKYKSDMKKIHKIAQSFKVSLGSHECLSDLLACMRAVADLHQTHHWQTRGSSYYGDHLLFERIYNESQSFVDQLAEKAIGLGNADLVDLCKQSELRHKKILEMCGETSNVSPQEMVERSLKAEKKLIEMTKNSISSLESCNQLTHGLSNLLEGIADAHEGFVYLLKQREEG
jgi:DNA-binding ferritin-like protein